MADNLKIGFAGDHAGIALKTALIEYASSLGYGVVDLGPHNGQSVDYPDYGFKLADAIGAGAVDFGVAVCGSGIGISIALNRHPQVRCALVTHNLMARLSRQHNNANVIAMGERLTGVDVAKDCLRAFLETPFDGGRHQRRVDKLGAPTFDA